MIPPMPGVMRLARAWLTQQARDRRRALETRLLTRAAAGQLDLEDVVTVIEALERAEEGYIAANLEVFRLTVETLVADADADPRDTSVTLVGEWEH